MTDRLLALVVNDLRLQFRYGIHIAYSVVVALYAGLVIAAGDWLPTAVIGVIIFTDPAALGFFFLGALMMLERSEGVRVALAVSPVSSGPFLAAKAATLTGLALVASAVLLLVAHRPANPVLLFLAVTLTSVGYIGIGVPIALKFRTVNAYLIGSAAFLTPVIAPGALALLDPTPAWALALPAVSQLRLMLVATGGASASVPEIAVMIAVTVAFAAAASWLALRSLKRELGK